MREWIESGDYDCPEMDDFIQSHRNGTKRVHVYSMHSGNYIDYCLGMSPPEWTDYILSYHKVKCIFDIEQDPPTVYLGGE